jgi:hypothetical protein
MALQAPFAFKRWIDENRHLLGSPVNNRKVAGAEMKARTA